MAAPTLLRTLAVALTMGSALATQIPRPPCLVPYEPFEYTGCFKDIGSPPALEWRSLLDQNAMTIEICTAYCKGNSNRYAGLSYYGVCYCGMSIEGPKADESECNLPCSGNKGQICGGDNILSVWEDPTFPSIGEATVDGFDAIGCWTDESGAGRALAYRQDMDASTMTNEKCQQKCLEGGYPLAGTEFAGMLSVVRAMKEMILTVDFSQASATAALSCLWTPRLPTRTTATCPATGTTTRRAVDTAE